MAYLPHAEELVSKAPLLVGPGLFSQVSEGLPLLLLPLPSLKRTLNCLRAESRYLSEHRNRLYFMADALNVRHTCHSVVTFAKRRNPFGKSCIFLWHEPIHIIPLYFELLKSLVL